MHAYVYVVAFNSRYNTFIHQKLSSSVITAPHTACSIVTRSLFLD